jgi:outer membrane protein assembly factor BamA
MVGTLARMVLAVATSVGPAAAVAACVGPTAAVATSVATSADGIAVATPADSVAVAISDAPAIVAIRFEGNRVTRESVLLREMSLRVGAAADPATIEANRQAILDLGLFRSVTARTEPSPGGVALVITVWEKRYVLALPRVDTSSDADLSYGAEVRWHNVFGLGHTFKAYYERGDFPEERDRESEETALLDYFVPHLRTTRYGLVARVERLDRSVPEDSGVRGATGAFDEAIRRAEFVLLHDYTHGRPRRGWTFGTGVLRKDQSTDGAFAPPEDGHALALVGIADYSDLRFDVYSETGRRFNARVEAASDAFASDYDYTQWTASWFDSRPLGDTPHQTLQLVAGAGFVTDGPRRRNTFSLGGSGALRGYESDFLEGDRYGYAALEYLRPLRWNWLRLLAIAEVGATGDNATGVSETGVYASVGLGVRVRFTAFVDVEIEFGVAYPLRGGDGPRFFAGGN